MIKKIMSRTKEPQYIVYKNSLLIYLYARFCLSPRHWRETTKVALWRVVQSKNFICEFVSPQSRSGLVFKNDPDRSQMMPTWFKFGSAIRGALITYTQKYTFGTKCKNIWRTVTKKLRHDRGRRKKVAWKVQKCDALSLAHAQLYRYLPLLIYDFSVRLACTCRGRPPPPCTRTPWTSYPATCTRHPWISTPWPTSISVRVSS